ncbi:MAG: hypothetical protein KY453_10275, partial [Gemmatimonadetes bacterium]|nr:hypothetical protein [Gemmatimonadota bacterium]
PLQTGIPRGMTLNQDRTRFYVVDVSYESVEVVDIASKRTLDTFTLSRGNETIRIWGQAIDPQERYAVVLTKSYRKLSDRFEVGEPTLLKVDLATHQVTDTVPWPDGDTRDRARMIFSPEGDLLYFFGRDIVVLETEGFTEVDRWEYTEALDPGLGRFDFGFPEQTYEEPGTFTGLFTLRDPVQNRRIMGIARVHLEERDVDFFTVGPADGVQFALAPGGRRAYGVESEVGNWRFWTFDLDERRVVRREPFQGRPRMRLVTSSNGEQLYIYNAGHTIDVYDVDTYDHLRTVELGADTTTELFVLPKP